MSDKVQGNGTVDAQVTAEVTNPQPSADQQATDTQPRKPPRDATSGQFVSTPKPHRGNLRAGNRRQRTARGRAVYRDVHDRKGVEFASQTWVERAYEVGSPLRQILGDKKASILRCDAFMTGKGKGFKEATRDGSLKEIVRCRHQLSRELESLLVQLEQMYRPAPKPTAPVEDNVVRVITIEDCDSGHMQLAFTDLDPTEAERAILDAGDLEIATDALTHSGIKANSATISAWWAGRSQSVLIPPTAPPSTSVTASSSNGSAPGTSKSNGSPSGADKPATVEPSTPTVRRQPTPDRRDPPPPPEPAPAASPTNVVPFLGSAAHRNFDTGKGR